MQRLPARFRWLPWVWLLFVYISAQRFTQFFNERSVEDAASGRPSLQNAIEVLFYLVMAVVLFFAWLPRSSTVGNNLHFVSWRWPAWALLSTSWSLVPKYSFVRALQLFVPVLLAVYTARVLDHLDDDGTAVARPFLRLFTNFVSGLAVFAFLYKPVATLETGRLTWYGVHPLVAAEFFGAAALCLLFAGHIYLRMSMAGWCCRLALLIVAVIESDSRGIFAGLIVAVTVDCG